MRQRPLISLLKKTIESQTPTGQSSLTQLDKRFTNSWAHFLPSFGIQRATNVCFSQAFLSASSVVKDSTEKRSSNHIGVNNSDQSSERRKEKRKISFHLKFCQTQYLLYNNI